jgi:DNA-binding response OmpR family regulator
METAKIPVIYMSGHYQALHELESAGIAYLQKPFRLAELLARVRNALPPSSPVIL